MEEGKNLAAGLAQLPLYRLSGVFFRADVVDLIQGAAVKRLMGPPAIEKLQISP